MEFLLKQTLMKRKCEMEKICYKLTNPIWCVPAPRCFIFSVASITYETEILQYRQCIHIKLSPMLNFYVKNPWPCLTYGVPLPIHAVSVHLLWSPIFFAFSYVVSVRSLIRGYVNFPLPCDSLGRSRACYGRGRQGRR